MEAFYTQGSVHVSKETNVFKFHSELAAQRYKTNLGPTKIANSSRSECKIFISSFSKAIFSSLTSANPSTRNSRSKLSAASKLDGMYP